MEGFDVSRGGVRELKRFPKVGVAPIKEFVGGIPGSRVFNAVVCNGGFMEGVSPWYVKGVDHAADIVKDAPMGSFTESQGTAGVGCPDFEGILKFTKPL